jgi:hypothetical protein
MISEVSNAGVNVSVELISDEGVVVATTSYDIGPSGNPGSLQQRPETRDPDPT